LIILNLIGFKNAEEGQFLLTAAAGRWVVGWFHWGGKWASGPGDGRYNWQHAGAFCVTVTAWQTRWGPLVLVLVNFYN